MEIQEGKYLHNEKVNEFFRETKKSFVFLENYGYQQIEAKIKNPSDYRDVYAEVTFKGKAVGISVKWPFAEAIISVAFFELQEGKLPKKRYFLGKNPEASKAIDIYSLAQFLNKTNENYFLLKDIDSVMLSKIKKRQMVLNSNLPGVISGLVCAVENLALNVVKGDTSIFDDVINFKTEKYEKMYQRKF